MVEELLGSENERSKWSCMMKKERYIFLAKFDNGYRAVGDFQ